MKQVDPVSLEWHELVTAYRDMSALIILADDVITDFLPNIGNCALQDIGKLNTFLNETTEFKLSPTEHID